MYDTRCISSTKYVHLVACLSTCQALLNSRSQHVVVNMCVHMQDFGSGLFNIAEDRSSLACASFWQSPPSQTQCPAGDSGL